ncbi:sensor histidine kinase [Pseudarthrobacter phenanthrenivorans]|uniref:Sensor-like histidine kinase SenX3 n=1 Tax=Pseudarthrobacter phenanthrenivorans (strain DSM 18606 / JCM 16027 / LMG 23796 / Sphe3) TaxID=930171 RepID=F0M8U5_PSEPM|nr:sensor histidine kinase [Pseudarthrobacter phenanthrenivorans]ADX72680.1 PAS domain S-box [Pseudarthrobacter phenanthrenivorans Sphe3]TPV48454.1 sensor histidine kinase [Pseudarthrobacter phenanthrenivorans]
MIHPWSIARRLFVANLLIVVVFIAIVGSATFVDARDRTYDEAGERMAGIAASIAANPLVLEAAAGPDPTAFLQPYADDVMAGADVDFITIMAPDRTRWTHPRQEEIGRPYIGSIDVALQGGQFTEVTAGTLGPSVRTIVPVQDDQGTVKALVAVGVTVRTVDVAFAGRLPALLAIGLALLVGGSLASWLLGRYLRRVTRGWGPEQLAQLFAYYESVLHSVREGLILIDAKGRVVMYNDQAAELLGLEGAGSKDPTRPPSLAELPLEEELRELFESGRTAKDEIILTGSRVLVVNQGPAKAPDSPGTRGRTPVYGTVATLRDRTEIEALGNELESMRTLSGALRAQTHEHANRLHTMVSLLELGRTQEALDFATRDLQLSQQLTDDMVSSVDEPVLGALVVGKVAEAHERGVQLDVATLGSGTVAGVAVQDLVTILGNLLDNAIDAAAEGPPPRRVELTVESDEEGLDIAVHDSGAALEPAAAERIFRHGFSTKPAGPGGRGIGLALVRQAVQRLGGTLTVNGRRGAKFEVFLPAAVSPQKEHTP